MSSYFRSAAMSLLSKTLQTFLYKYLSEVDVEGVELPSLYYSDEQSGYGVRLSNVKLRDGAELMTLPGIRRKKKRKKRQTAATDKQGQQTSVVAEEIDPKMVKNVKEQNKLHERRFDDPKDDNNNLSSGESTITGREVDTADRGTLLTEDDSDSETLASQDGESSQQTPTKPSFFCFKPHSSTSKPPPETKTTKEELVAEEQQTKASTKELIQQTSSHENKKQTEGNDNNNDQDTPAKNSIINRNDPGMNDNNGGDREGNCDDIGDDDDSEGFLEQEPMVLRLGKDGYIGTLDIKWVGKELHVLVEDAFLAVEATPKGGTREEKNRESEKKAAEDKAKKAAMEKKGNDDKKSVGDRIIANNPIAKALSMIPHLFLRDIRLRLVVRAGKDQQDRSVDDAENDPLSAAVVAEDATSLSDLHPEDSALEFGIEFLSVTSGEDFLAKFQTDDDAGEVSPEAVMDDNEEDDSSVPLPPTSLASVVEDSTVVENDFLFRWIRTGKGPDGGLWLKIFPPSKEATRKSIFFSKQKKQCPVSDGHCWARQEWIETSRNCFFRISGLDTRARIYLGTKTAKIKVDANSSSFVWSSGNDDDDFSETMLYGIDSIAPGPIPVPVPVPAVAEYSNNINKKIREEESKDSTMYYIDSNGIQSSKMDSNFHRVARGLVPTFCATHHLPCETCSECWDTEKRMSDMPMDHPLDSSMPLPGVAVSVSLTEPFEMNIDRLSLDVIGLVLGLFNEPNDATEPKNNDPDSKTEAETAVLKEARENVSSGASASDRAEASNNEQQDTQTHEQNVGGCVTPDSGISVSSAFPSYMKPEAISLMGLNISDVLLRIHVMQDDGSTDVGFSFCYWEVKAKCVTVDQHDLSSSAKTFQDLRLDIGLIQIAERRGTHKEQLISCGLPYLEEKDADADTTSVPPTKLNDVVDKHHRRPPWPTTVCSYLDVSPSHESLMYESRERHGLQMRYINLVNPRAEKDVSRGSIDVRVGVTSLNMRFAVKEQVYMVKSEAMDCLFGPKEEIEDASTARSQAQKSAEDTKNDRKKPSDSVMKYRIQIDGGHLCLFPLVDIRLPLTRFSGESSSDVGDFFETVLDRVEMKYGQRRPSRPTILTQSGLSLRRVVDLPESVRLRILLCLDDLAPLEKALGVKTESNSFLRCRAVNKRFAKIAKKIAKSTNKSSSSSSRKATKNKYRSSSSTGEGPSSNSQRQKILTEILKLDDHALERLWLTHTKDQKKRRPKKRK